MIEEKYGPVLNDCETPFKLGYVSLVVMGARGYRSERSAGTPATNQFGLGRHCALIKFLTSLGAPVDLADIGGRTALFHAIASPGQVLRLDIIRALLEAGADVDHQDRFGGVALTEALIRNCSESVDMLMEFGAQFNEAQHGYILCLCSPKMGMVVHKWLRRRAGEEAPPLASDQCDNCHLQCRKLSKC